MYNPYSLVGKTILVTGASSGIGKSIAEESAIMGARLIITGRNEERLKAVFNSLSGSGHEYIVADLSNYDDIEKVVNSCPQLDGISNNAGIIKIILVKFINRDYLHDIFNTNTIGPILLTNLLVKKKKINKMGSIVFTSSLSGVFCAHYGESMYAASKGAISGFAKGAALDLSSQGIRVNCVNPGIVQTNIFNTAGVITEDDLADKVSLFPLKRLGLPADIAYAHIFLLSNASSWITGINIPIDGGYTLI